MTVPSIGIADILIAANIGITLPGTPGAWPIFNGQLPQDIDQAIAAIDRGGRQPEVRVAIDYPSVQLLVRSSKRGYAAARQKAEDIFQVLQAIPNGGEAFPELTSCVAATAIAFAGFDESERPIHSLNFNLIVSNPPQGNRDL